MTNEQPITIDADTVRRMALNAERNPRETIYGEATQTLNPITGRPYADGSFMPEYERVSIKKELFGYSFTERKKGNLIFYDFGEKEKSKSITPRTNSEIELQKALGRMEVREGNLPDFAYGEFLDDVEKLADLYAQNPGLTLESITDLTGLNAALGPFVNGRLLRKIEFGPYKRIIFSEINKLSPEFPKDKYWTPKHEFIEFLKPLYPLDKLPRH